MFTEEETAPFLAGNPPPRRAPSSAFFISPSDYKAARTTLCHATATGTFPPTAGDRERRARPLRFASANLTSTAADLPRNLPPFNRPSKCLTSLPFPPPTPDIPTFLGMLEY